MKWRHSGFSINNGLRIKRDDAKGRESVAQYILRNPFSVEKMTYNDKSGTVIYRSKMTHGKNKKNFNAYTAEEFIAAITQHIPEKSFQMVRYYGWHSNKSRGMRLKRGIVRPGDESLENDAEVEIIDVSDYEPKRIPSRTWRECIKKIWEVDPLECPKCGGEMKIISFITEASVIRQILEHLNLWEEKLSRDPPEWGLINEDSGVVREPFDDGWGNYDEYSPSFYMP
jgi:Putative transposase